MNDILFIPGGVTAPKGFKASGIHCGIRAGKTKKDLALIFAEKQCDAAAVYTKNLVKGAPLLVTMEHLKGGKARAIICNSGNANTCNADGVAVAESICASLAEILSIRSEEVIIASTGVIGQPLNLGAITAGLSPLREALSHEGSGAAAEAIMTTDLAKKEFAVEFTLSGKPCRIGAIAKGSGMINPNMATMLSFITTDANIAPHMLKKALRESVSRTYNMVSVDGDTSTNDMVAVMASGLAGNPRIVKENDDYHAFRQALDAVNTAVSRSIARDGEGATKLLECTVRHFRTERGAARIAKTVIMSNLVKAAMFGADANWGRILCAVGYSGEEVAVDRVDIGLRSASGEIKVCENGAGLPFDEAAAKRILSESEVIIDIDLKDGEHSATAWGCDLTYDYVKINGDYRT